MYQGVLTKEEDFESFARSIEESGADLVTNEHHVNDRVYELEGEGVIRCDIYPFDHSYKAYVQLLGFSEDGERLGELRRNLETLSSWSELKDR
jgi:hypothetical protein|tara:strand:- start:550 stop:828 length:279 start_codon:yes stop_codon:yes gene_type:complete